MINKNTAITHLLVKALYQATTLKSPPSVPQRLIAEEDSLCLKVISGQALVANRKYRPLLTLIHHVELYAIVDDTEVTDTDIEIGDSHL